MSKLLIFNKKPELSDLEGLSVNGGKFEIGKGFLVKNEIILMKIPNTFRFSTNLEILKDTKDRFNLVMVQFLTRGTDLWEMSRAFDRIGFRNPEIEEQMRLMCDALVEKDLAYCIDED